MKDHKQDLVSIFKFEKYLKISVAIYLSIILLAIVGILVKINMAIELQQALIVVLGLITIATLDAFRKALDSTPSSFANEFQQIIIQEGGFYIGGDYVVDYFNQAGEKRQTLAEAAAEIEQLLKQLEKSNPNATDVEKVAFVNDETPPNFKSRLISALKSGGLTTLDIMSSPYSQIFSAIIDGWITTEKSSKPAQPNNIDSVK
jgi:ABC-type glycerol-3-phosphate transport system substrate-binding protein